MNRMLVVLTDFYRLMTSPPSSKIFRMVSNLKPLSFLFAALLVLVLLTCTGLSLACPMVYPPLAAETIPLSHTHHRIEDGEGCLDSLSASVIQIDRISSGYLEPLHETPPPLEAGPFVRPAQVSQWSEYFGPPRIILLSTCCWTKFPWWKSCQTDFQRLSA